MIKNLTGMHLNGRFTLIGEVGRGRTGTVYKAEDEKTGHPVAIKILNDEVSPEDKQFLRFRQEAETASSLSHPNVVKIYDFGIADGLFPFVVMEYITGLLLSSKVEIEGRLPVSKAVPILLQICDAMRYSHEQGVIHRDLRPENVFLVDLPGQKEFVKIVDFGVAKNIKSANQRQLTGEKEMLGTPEYTSPEVILGKPTDNRSDIYSMGCLMYKVLTGQLPFDIKNAADALQQKIGGSPKSISDPSRGRHLPANLQSCVNKALLKEPDQRQQSMEEIIEVLNSLV